MKQNPIHYKTPSEIRFSDFDVNGHLYSAKYIDIVVSSRFRFFENHFGQKIDIFAEKSIGLVITSLEIFYRKPICSLAPVIADSYIDDIDDRGGLRVRFSLMSHDESIKFVEGSYIQQTIDLKIMKKCSLPKWAEKYFFMEEVT